MEIVNDFEFSTETSEQQKQQLSEIGGEVFFPGLTEGSQVNYVLPDGRNAGEIRPAFVVRVWRNVSPELIAKGYCNLVVFIDGTNDYCDAQGHTIWATSKTYSETKEPGTWHWPNILMSAK